MTNPTKTWAVVLLLASCGGPSGGATIADGCTSIGTTLCRRMDACGALVVAAGECIAEFVTGCCAGDNCDKPLVDLQYVTDCRTALDDLTCAQVSTGYEPSACVSK